MSLSALLVIFIVILLVAKPSDLPGIIEKIKQINHFFMKTKQEIFTFFDKESQAAEIVTEDNISHINFYLEKISALGGNYEGEYSFNKIKSHYHTLTEQFIDNQIQENSITQSENKKIKDK